MKILNTGFIYAHGRDNRFRPILVLDPSVFIKNNKTFSIQDWVLSIIYLFEYIKVNCFLPGQIENWNIICDVAKINVCFLPPEFKSILHALQSNYRCRLYKALIINVSFFVKAIWNLVRNMLDTATERKIRLINVNDNINIEIFTFINRSQVEKKFGGEAENVERKYFPPLFPSNEYFTDYDNPRELLVSDETYWEIIKTNPELLSKPVISKCKEIIAANEVDYNKAVGIIQTEASIYEDAKSVNQSFVNKQVTFKEKEAEVSNLKDEWVDCMLEDQQLKEGNIQVEIKIKEESVQNNSCNTPNVIIIEGIQELEFQIDPESAGNKSLQAQAMPELIQKLDGPQSVGRTDSQAFNYDKLLDSAFNEDSRIIQRPKSESLIAHHDQKVETKQKDDSIELKQQLNKLQEQKEESSVVIGNNLFDHFFNRHLQGEQKEFSIVLEPESPNESLKLKGQVPSPIDRTYLNSIRDSFPNNQANKIVPEVKEEQIIIKEHADVPKQKDPNFETFSKPFKISDVFENGSNINIKHLSEEKEVANRRNLHTDELPEAKHAESAVQIHRNPRGSLSNNVTEQNQKLTTNTNNLELVINVESNIIQEMRATEIIGKARSSQKEVGDDEIFLNTPNIEKANKSMNSMRESVLSGKNLNGMRSNKANPRIQAPQQFKKSKKAESKEKEKQKVDQEDQTFIRQMTKKTDFTKEDKEGNNIDRDSNRNLDNMTENTKFEVENNSRSTCCGGIMTKQANGNSNCLII